MPELDPAAPLTLAEAMRLHEIEGNPLSPDEIEMFKMFEREGWGAERRTAYIIDQIRAEEASNAAE